MADEIVMTKELQESQSSEVAPQVKQLDEKQYKKLAINFSGESNKKTLKNALIAADEEKNKKLKELKFRKPYIQLGISIALGLFGVDRFYRQKWVTGVFKLLATIIFFILPAIIPLPWQIIPIAWWVLDSIIFFLKAKNDNRLLISNTLKMEMTARQVKKANKLELQIRRSTLPGYQLNVFSKTFSIFGYIILFIAFLPWAITTETLKLATDSIDYSLATIQNSVVYMVEKTSSDAINVAVPKTMEYSEPMLAKFDGMQNAILPVKNVVSKAEPVLTFFKVDATEFLNFSLRQTMQSCLYTALSAASDQITIAIKNAFSISRSTTKKLFDAAYKTCNILITRYLIVFSIWAILLFNTAFLFSLLIIILKRKDFKGNALRTFAAVLIVFTCLGIRFKTKWPEHAIMHACGVYKLLNELESSANTAGNAIKSIPEMIKY